jgi:hypothetical protein
MNKKSDREYTHLMYRAYMRDGQTLHTGEALLLACLMHAKGAGRKTHDMRDVQRIMKDVNYKPSAD